jgi:hypothetical protein
LEADYGEFSVVPRLTHRHGFARACSLIVLYNLLHQGATMRAGAQHKSTGRGTKRTSFGSLRLYLRRAMAAIAITVSVLALALALGYKSLRLNERFRYHILVYTELTKSGIDLKSGESDKLADVTLILLGSLAGLVLAKPDEAKLTLQDKPELLMFISALALLLSSTIFHESYISSIADDVYLQGSADRTNRDVSLDEQPPPDWRSEGVVTPAPPAAPFSIEYQLSVEDPRDPALDYLLQGQLWFFLVGTVLAGMTLGSAQLLKEENRDEGLSEQAV